MSNGKEQFLSYNSLVCVAQGVIGLYTTVDLRNDSYVSGKIDQVDGFMNVVISDAVFTDACGNEYYFELFFVKERNIRYIHIPSEVNIKDTLVDKIIVKQQRTRPKPPPKPMSLKRKKLLIRQQETLERVRQIKLEREAKKLQEMKKS